MNLWSELLAHPAWRQLEIRWHKDKDDATRRLLAVARVSTDAAVRAEALRIDTIGLMLRIPVDAAARGSDE